MFRHYIDEIRGRLAAFAWERFLRSPAGSRRESFWIRLEQRL